MGCGKMAAENFFYPDRYFIKVEIQKYFYLKKAFMLIPKKSATVTKPIIFYSFVLKWIEMFLISCLWNFMTLHKFNKNIFDKFLRIISVMNGKKLLFVCNARIANNIFRSNKNWVPKYGSDNTLQFRDIFDDLGSRVFWVISVDKYISRVVIWQSWAILST